MYTLEIAKGINSKFSFTVKKDGVAVLKAKKRSHSAIVVKAIQSTPLSDRIAEQGNTLARIQNIIYRSNTELMRFEVVVMGEHIQFEQMNTTDMKIDMILDMLKKKKKNKKKSKKNSFKC